MIQYLGHSAASFFELPLELEPFGKGPWPCLNHACDYFNIPVIGEYQLIKFGNGRLRSEPAGRFTCSCGFSYYRVGPDENPEDRFRYTKVVAYGEQWDRKLTAMWNDPTISISNICKEFSRNLQFLEPHALRLGLSNPRQGPKSTLTISSDSRNMFTESGAIEVKVEAYRQEFLKIIAQTPEADRTTISKQHRKIYDFLYGHDQEWLNQTLPSKRSSRNSTQQLPHIEWSDLDCQLVELVKEAAQNLRNDSNRFRQVSKRAIGEEISHLKHLKHNLSKLPLTKKALSEVLETRVEFALRRISRTVVFFQERGMSPSKTAFFEKAQLSRIRSTDRSEELQKAIDVALTTLSNL